MSLTEYLKLLEFDKVKELYTKYCFSEGGKVKIMEAHPTFYPWEELNLVEEMLKLLRFYDLPSSYDYDIDDLLHKALMGNLLEPMDFLRIESFLQGCSAFKSLGRRVDAGRLKQKLLNIKENPSLIHDIRKVVSEDGEVKDTASEELKRIRTRKREVIKELKKLSERLKEKYRMYLQDELVVVRDGRFMLAVKSSFRPKVKGIVHHSSASGATLFVEPEEIVPLNDERRILEEDERREVNRILRRLTNEILGFMESFKSNLGIIHHIDAVYAKAMYLLKEDGIIVHPSKDSEIKLVGARHPLIPKERVVPIDISIPRNKAGVIITGPNMGGKTVTLKTIGLFTALAMAGFPIPAREGTKLSLYEKVLVDIGEEQDIELSLSTFSSHMGRIAKILKEADMNSLVLIDELGSGTDPMEGSALAISIVEELINKGAKFVITTHMSPLKLMAIQRDEIESASMEFDPVTLKPTYRVLMGVPGASHAFEIAENLGIERAVIERAKKHFSGEGVEVESVIKKLQDEVRNVRLEKERLEMERRKYEKEKARYKSEYERLKRERIEELDKELKELTEQVDDTMRKLERAISALKKKRSVEELRELVKELGEEKKRLKSLEIPSERVEFKVGDNVRIKDGTSVGKVLEDRGEKVLVDFGTMKVEMKKKDLVIIKEVPKVEKVEKKVYMGNILEKPEIDIRGLTVEEAENVILDFIDRLVISDFDKGYIIHGKGTGRLAAGVWEILRKDPRVKNYRFGMQSEGGTGVTVVEV